jgi:hypothetical protein
LSKKFPFGIEIAFEYNRDNLKPNIVNKAKPQVARESLDRTHGMGSEAWQKIED